MMSMILFNVYNAKQLFIRLNKKRFELFKSIFRNVMVLMKILMNGHVFHANITMMNIDVMFVIKLEEH